MGEERGGKQGLGQKHQTGSGDDEKEGQGQPARNAVRVAPEREPVFTGPKGEKIPEEVPAQADAADADQQQGKSRHAYGLAADAAIQTEEIDVQAVQERAASGFPRRKRPAGFRIEQFRRHAVRIMHGLSAGPCRRGYGSAFRGQVHAPHFRVRRAPGQVGESGARGFDFFARTAALRRVMGFRLHPEGDFVAVQRQRTHEKKKNSQPAEDKPGPGMQFTHTAAERSVHGRSSFAPERSSGVSPIWYRTARKGKRTMETRNAAALASKGGRGSTEARPGARAHSVMNAAASAPAVRSQGRHSGGREGYVMENPFVGEEGKTGAGVGRIWKTARRPGQGESCRGVPEDRRRPADSR